jgi:dTDP-D-glucose 4,6-dehydratase
VDLIVNYDQLTYAGNLNNLMDVSAHPSYYFIHGDICERNLVDNVMARYRLDGIVDFAAESHVDRSIADSNLFVY